MRELVILTLELNSFFLLSLILEGGIMNKTQGRGIFKDIHIVSLTFAGIPLAIGTWSGALVAIIISMIAYQYRIRIEEDALQEAFGSEYEEYKKRTWKLLPGF
jgi:hypothetical protein